MATTPTPNRASPASTRTRGSREPVLIGQVLEELLPLLKPTNAGTEENTVSTTHPMASCSHPAPETDRDDDRNI